MLDIIHLTSPAEFGLHSCVVEAFRHDLSQSEEIVHSKRAASSADKRERVRLGQISPVCRYRLGRPVVAEEEGTILPPRPLDRYERELTPGPRMERVSYADSLLLSVPITCS